MPVNPLATDALYRECDAALIPFDTTAQDTTARAADAVPVVGQERASEALSFATALRRHGYNVYAQGVPGTGRRTLIERHLRAVAATAPTPSDWCYVHHFSAPDRPLALRFPAGTGRAFCNAMTHLVEDLKAVLPAAFESEGVQAARQVIEQDYRERHERNVQEVRERARARNVALISTPGGFAFAPMRAGEVMSPQDFHNLPPPERAAFEQAIAELERELGEHMRRLPGWQKEARARLRELGEQTALAALAGPVGELLEAFGAHEGVAHYLEALRSDVAEHYQDFLTSGEETPSTPFLPGPSLTRYAVNLLIEHAPGAGAPVVYADLPTYPNLIGRLDHQARFGALSTDFTLIKPGALHAANGGYLIVDAARVLTQPYAWEGLKRALRARELRIEPLERVLGALATVSLDPRPIPLDVQVVMIGERRVYDLLGALDPEFSELFKVSADFEDDVPRDGAHVTALAGQLANLARTDELLAFGRDAVARVIEHAARLADDAERLSVRMADLRDLMVQADHYARAADRAQVDRDAVERALEAQRQRHGRVPTRAREAVARGIVLIDTDGTRVGQVNGLAVYQVGGSRFGRPSRISVRVRPGAGGVVDIEREVELGGPIHSKGVLILSGFLGGRFAAQAPLALSASVVFEQSYSGVDGDSASSAELYALLSALADLPLRQDLAVTGSVNQYGEVQAIGGVNEKIEGFFEACQVRGLSGRQGVLVPASNVQHLMLRADVREAAAGGRFHVYPVRTVDEGIELLTGIPAGAPATDGSYPDGTVNARVAQRLAEFARLRRAAGPAGEGGPGGHGRG